MPKLFQINTVDYGSTGKIAKAIGQLASIKGWESYIAFSRGEGNNEFSSMIRIGSHIDMIMHGIRTRLFDDHGLTSQKATKNLIEQIKTINPDIIHLHNIHGYYLNYEILFEFLKSIKTPIVWTLHDCWPFTGHCSHFMASGCDKWITGCNKCTQLNHYPKSYLDNSNRNYIKKKNAFTSTEDRLTLVPVSDFLSNYIPSSFLHNCKINVIKNGVDLNIFKPTLKKETKSVIAVSNVWEQRKGLRDILKLRTLLPADYKLTIVGLNKRHLKSLPDGILGIERTSNQSELADLYSQSSFFINTTYEDSFPTVNLEALACGTPVITYRTGGSPEAIDINTGFVIEQGNIQKMSEIIISNSEMAHQMSNKCRQRAEKLFNQDLCFNQYIELYGSLLRRHSK